MGAQHSTQSKRRNGSNVHRSANGLNAHYSKKDANWSPENPITISEVNKGIEDRLMSRTELIELIIKVKELDVEWYRTSIKTEEMEIDSNPADTRVESIRFEVNNFSSRICETGKDLNNRLIAFDQARPQILKSKLEVDYLHFELERLKEKVSECLNKESNEKWPSTHNPLQRKPSEEISGQESEKVENRIIYLMSGQPSKAEVLYLIQEWIEKQPGSPNDKARLRTSLINAIYGFGDNTIHLLKKEMSKDRKIIDQLHKDKVELNERLEKWKDCNAVLNVLVKQYAGENLGLLQRQWRKYTKEDIVARVSTWLKEQVGSDEEKTQLKAYLLNQICRLGYGPLQIEVDDQREIVFTDGVGSSPEPENGSDVDYQPPPPYSSSCS